MPNARNLEAAISAAAQEEFVSTQTAPLGIADTGTALEEFARTETALVATAPLAIAPAVTANTLGVRGGGVPSTTVLVDRALSTGHAQVAGAHSAAARVAVALTGIKAQDPRFDHQ